MITFTIHGQPQGKARPRVTRNGTYTPQKTKDYQNQIKAEYITQTGNITLDGELSATITCYYKIPKSTSKAKRKLIEDGKLRPVVKPDLDNVGKAVLDALNKVAYKDDSAIVELRLRKFYSDDPRVVVILKEVE